MGKKLKQPKKKCLITNAEIQMENTVISEEPIETEEEVTKTED